MSIQLRFERLPGNDLQLPKYATDGSAAFDLAACLRRPVVVPSTKEWTDRRLYEGRPHFAYWVDCQESDVAESLTPSLAIQPGDRFMIPTGWKLAFPPGHVMNVYPRSSCVKTGLQLANSVAVIDSDYRGELFVVLLNTGAEKLVISHGERIAQATIVPIVIPTIEEGPVGETARSSGGFGSTGK